MKKIYQQPKYKKYQKKKFYDALERRRSRRLKLKLKTKKIQELMAVVVDDFYQTKVVKTHTKKSVTLFVPKDANVLSNPEGVLDFFNEFLKEVKKNNDHIRLDMSEVENLGPNFILYMLFLFDYFKSLNKTFRVSGNDPQNGKCKELLKESGFYKHVNSRFRIETHEAEILSVKTDFIVKPGTAADVLRFALKHLSQEWSHKSTRIYESLIELMANTKQHAYKTDALVPKWYLMACNNSESNRVSFTFLDGGMGIPSTIRKKPSEVLQNIVGLISFDKIKILKDNELLDSALRGEFRSKTKDAFRGKGLPSIKQANQDHSIENLTIVANAGFIDCTTGNASELPIKFLGTLFSWDFV